MQEHIKRELRRSGVFLLCTLILILAISLLACGRHTTKPFRQAQGPAPSVAEGPQQQPDIPPPDSPPRVEGIALRPLPVVYFDFDRYHIRLDQKDALEGLYLALLEPGPWHGPAVIAGHADERGTDGYNLALGQRRADTVRLNLVRLGIPSDHLRTVSYGEERPADPGHDEAAWGKNRRVELVVP